MNKVKLLSLMLVSAALAACGNNPQCPPVTGYSEAHYVQPMRSSQYYQEQEASNRVGDLATGAVVGAAVGHLATKNSNNKLNGSAYSAPKQSVKSKPKSGYKNAIATKKKPAKKTVSLSKSKRK